MPGKTSAGILLYKKVSNSIYILLVHPGGPFWVNKDLASWSIPKGEFTESEKPFDAALREFEEETGSKLNGVFIELTPITLKSGKIIYVWAHEQDLDTKSIICNHFQLEWPPKSGVLESFPEVDRAEWFTIEQALQKINPSQADLINQLKSRI